MFIDNRWLLQSRLAKKAFFVVPFLLLLLMFAPFGGEAKTLVAKRSMDILHLPFAMVLYGWVYMCGLVLARTSPDGKLFRLGVMPTSLVHKLISLQSVVVIGFLVEVIQPVSGRSFEWADLALDFSGGVLALCLHIRPKRVVVRFAQVIVFALVLACSLVPLGSAVSASKHMREIFPKLITFSSSWERYYYRPISWDDNHPKARVVWPKSASEGAYGNQVRGLEVDPSAGGGGVSFSPIEANWSNCQALDIGVVAEGLLRLGIRLDDEQSSSDYEDRFNKSIWLEAGIQNISIPFEEIVQTPAGRKLDLANLRRLLIFASPNGGLAKFVIFKLELRCP